MTRKDYEVIAAALRQSRVPPNGRPIQPERSAWWRTFDAITIVLAADNPRLDTKRFRSASGE